MPLIAHSIQYAQKHAFIDAVYVTTNDEAIAKVARQYGAEIIMRPEAISGDFEPTVSALKHVLQNIDEVADVVLLQPTNPLRPEKLLEEAYAVYQNGNCDSLFSVTRNHQKFGKIVNDKFVPYNYEIGQRSQDLEPLYFENGLLYISKSELILNGSIISENACPYLVEHLFAAVDIDTQEDFDYAEYLLGKVRGEK